MATGLAWNVSNPFKPWARFDANAIRDIPFEWDLWLADIGATHASHTITCEAPMTCSQSSEASGIITARIKVGAGIAEIGTKYAVTCHIVASDGQEDDQTIFLKMVEK